MEFHFEFALEDEWPSLAWVAQCVQGDAAIRVRHGRQVEVRADWFCEAIWDGDFDSGAIDLTDVVFGSGARLRDGRVVFVSAASTVDRLQFLRRPGEVMISNSLACLLAVGKVEVDPTFDEWQRFFYSIKDGIVSYARRLPTTGSADVELVYFRNLVWDGNNLREEDKPELRRDFSSFENYFGFLDATVKKLAANMSSPSRHHRYQMIGTLSSGYDAATAATICREAGMTKVISVRQARGGADSGRGVARILRFQQIHIERTGWRAKTLPEIPFFAASSTGGEAFFSAAEELLRGTVLVTGFHGDKVWGKETKALEADVVRGDVSGLSLCEFRLSLGCIHFPLPFLGVRQIRDINKLSNSPELRSWDVPGDYSRPICRRIVEQAGVPRGMFGTEKKMASLHFGMGESMLSDRTRNEYYHWLKSRRSILETTGVRQRSIPGRVLVAVRARYYLVWKIVRVAERLLPARAASWATRTVTALQWELSRRINLPEYVFPWAVAQLGKLYSASPLCGNDDGLKSP